MRKTQEKEKGMEEYGEEGWGRGEAAGAGLCSGVVNKMEDKATRRCCRVLKPEVSRRRGGVSARHSHYGLCIASRAFFCPVAVSWCFLFLFMHLFISLLNHLLTSFITRANLQVLRGDVCTGKSD